MNYYLFIFSLQLIYLLLFAHTYLSVARSAVPYFTECLVNVNNNNNNNFFKDLDIYLRIEVILQSCLYGFNRKTILRWYRVHTLIKKKSISFRIHFFRFFLSEFMLHLYSSIFEQFKRKNYIIFNRIAYLCAMWLRNIINTVCVINY